MSRKRKARHDGIAPTRTSMSRDWNSYLKTEDDIERALSERTVYVDTFNRARLDPHVARILRTHGEKRF